MRLAEFLDSKPLFYDEIDYSRMPRVYEKIKNSLSPLKIIHLIGTNGKGTTGRFLASALYSLGFSVGHYTSPHILKFNERIWLNGSDISDEKLQSAHIELQRLLSPEDSDSLSYFEYTTLLAVLLFCSCDYVVMEAGLGGEYDATAVFDKYLTLVTPIDIDHEAFLGSTIKEIATTKLKAVQNEAILAVQNFDEVYEVADVISQEKNVKMNRVDSFVDALDRENIKIIATKLSLAPYLKENLKLTVAALKIMGLEYTTDNFNNSLLFGRLSKIGENVILDVGHNTLAATSILTSLKGKKYVLIYNSYKDKDYKKILHILKPIIKRVEIIQIESQRGELVEILQSTLNELSIQWGIYNKLESDEEYLVFGSFSVAEAFLKEYRG